MGANLAGGSLAKEHEAPETEEEKTPAVVDDPENWISYVEMGKSVESEKEIADTVISLEDVTDIEIISDFEEKEDVLSMLVPATCAGQWQTPENDLLVAVPQRAGVISVYESANSSSACLGLMAPLTAGKAISLEVTDEGNWYEIVSGEIRGFARTDYFISGSDVLFLANDNGLVAKADSTDKQFFKLELPVAEAFVDYGVKEEDENFGSGINVTKKVGSIREDNEHLTFIIPESDPTYASYSVEDLSAYQTASEERKRLVEMAVSYVGGPYVWGGNSLTNGVDCSGFTQQLYKAIGYDLPRRSVEQANAYTKIPVADVLPGDLVFYARNGQISHVAMYIGDGKIVHARNAQYGIVIGNMSGEYSAISILPRE